MRVDVHTVASHPGSRGGREGRGALAPRALPYTFFTTSRDNQHNMRPHVSGSNQSQEQGAVF